MPGFVKDDCFAHAGKLLLHDEAIALLSGRVEPIGAAESVSLDSVLGRIASSPVIAPCDVPPHANSAVDGYAFAYADYDPSSGTSFKLAGRAAAGHPIARSVPSGSAARILTGAVLPQGLDTVAMQEDCILDGDMQTGSSVQVRAGLRHGANVRLAGEDVAQDQVLLGAGDFIRPQDIAALASVGLSDIRCYRRLRVAIASTGDELVQPGSRPPRPGQVYDANALMLRALVGLAGGELQNLGIWPDRAAIVQANLAEAAGRCDVVLTSGGASRSEEDHLAAAIAKLGSRHLWQIAIKPGRSIMFGQIGDAVVVALPGNPVAVFVCFLLYVWPLLRRLSGAPWPEPRRLLVKADFEFKGRKRGRREYWRGRLRRTASGVVAEKYERDGSALISSLRAADGLIEIPEDAGDIRRGDDVAFIPLTEFGILDH